MRVRICVDFFHHTCNLKFLLTIRYDGLNCYSYKANSISCSICYLFSLFCRSVCDYYVKYTLMPGDCECMDLAISFTYMHAAIPALVWLQLTFTSIKVALAAKFLLSVGFDDRKQPHQPSQLCCVLIYRKGFYVIGSGIQQTFISPSIWSSMHLSK